MSEHASISLGIKVMRLSVALLGLLFAFLSVQSGLSMSYAAADPAFAHFVSPRNAIALNWLTERKMIATKVPSDIEKMLGSAQETVRLAPLQAEAIRNIGFVIAARGDEAKGDQIIGLAGQVSKRDYFSHAWLFDRKFRLNQVAPAVTEADIILRQRIESWPLVIPKLAQLTGDERVIEPLAQSLAQQPYWRGTFLEALGKTGPDTDKIYALLGRLKALGAPPKTAELQSYFNRHSAHA